MICPKCEYEYVEGITVCPDCNIELVTKETFEGHLINPEDWVVVITSDNEIEIEMFKDNLMGAEIESLIISQKDRIFPVVGNLSIIRLLVHKDRAAEAIEIIKDIQNMHTDEAE